MNFDQIKIKTNNIRKKDQKDKKNRRFIILSLKKKKQD